MIVKSSRTFVRSAGSWSVLSECMKYVYDPFHWSTRIFWMKNSGNTKEINMGRYHATMNHEAAGQGKGECIWLHNWTENMFKYIPLAGCAGYNNSGPCPMTCRVVLCRRFSISYPSGINANNLVKYLDNQKIHDCAKCPSLWGYPWPEQPPLVSLLSLSQESGAAQLQGAVLTAADIEVVNCLQVYTCSLTAYCD